MLKKVASLPRESSRPATKDHLSADFPVNNPALSAIMSSGVSEDRLASPDSRMMDVASSTRTYVLGHSQDELARLEQQGAIFAGETEMVFHRAGLKPGMRVLDIGCGVGDVSLIAARIVGPGGAVLGVDRSEEALDYARRRAKKAGYDWLSFEAADLNTFDSGGKYDALTGRFILLYMSHPAAALRRLIGHVERGGIAAFLEFDINQAGAVPEMPLLSRLIYWVTETYRRVGIEPNMGSKLYTTFRAAGLTPEMMGTCRVEGGADAVAHEFAAETVRSLVPHMISLGIATADEIALDTLAERLRDAAVAGDHCIFLPRLVGAWARVEE
jgi:ubiquinone/menaquinone biosynthesis C-methylase UbiE